MKKYFLHDGQIQQGPFDIDELKFKKITADTHVWFETLNEWTPAGQVAELKSLFAGIPPPFKSATPPSFDKPLPTDYADEFIEQPKNKKFLNIGLGLLGLVVVILIFYFSNKSSGTTSTIQQINPLDTSVVYANDKRRLDSLEQIEKARQLRNNALTKKNMEYRNNWQKYIKHHPNNYRVNSLGGIYGLEISVANNTDNIIDEVVVTIVYFKSDGSHNVRKEVPVYNIQPNSYKSVTVPDTNRGTKIETEISKITSRSLHFCYDYVYDNLRPGIDSIAGMPERKPGDPWFCK